MFNVFFINKNFLRLPLKSVEKKKIIFFKFSYRKFSKFFIYFFFQNIYDKKYQKNMISLFL